MKVNRRAGHPERVTTKQTRLKILPVLTREHYTKQLRR
jgi:hypothetical protein